MAKKKTTVKRDALSLAAKVSSRVELEDVRLIEGHFVQTTEANKGECTIKISHEAHVQVNKKEKFIAVIPTFHLEGLHEEKSVVKIDATFFLAYRIDKLEGLRKNNFDAFGSINGIYNAWPYWREYVQNIIARMGLPNLTLPVFRI